MVAGCDHRLQCHLQDSTPGFWERSGHAILLQTEIQHASVAAHYEAEPLNPLRRVLKLVKRTGDREPPLPYSHVKLFHWRPDDGSVNFGDFLSLIIVRRVLAEHERELEDETSKSARMLAVGSIIHLAKDGDIIWGSGINGRVGQERPFAKRLDVRAVRGPKTRSVMIKRGFDVPHVYGDPALLLPRLFPTRFQRKPRRKHVFVPNLSDLPLTNGLANVVSPLQSWGHCVDAILSAEIVLASSLHGLIVAEAFGIPARYVRLSDAESLFKYEDYYEGTGRSGVQHVTTIEQGLELGGVEPPVFDADALLAAFPLDLWTS